MRTYTTINCKKEDKKRLTRIGNKLFEMLDLEKSMPEYTVVQLILDFVEAKLDEFSEFVKNKLQSSK